MEEERATAARPPRLLSLGKFGEGRSEEGQDLEDQEKNDGGRRHTDLSAGRSSKVARAIGYRQFAGEEIHPPLSKPGFVTRPRGPNDDTDTKKGFASCAAAAAAARVGAEGAVSRCTPSLLLLSILAWCLVGSVSAAGLEATLIAVDLSGFMVNADYPPSRLQCQYECVNLITTVKMQNPESAVGLMSMSCRDEECPRVHIAPAMDSEQHDVLNKLHALNRHPANRVQFEKAMEVGFMCLKNRANKNQSPRIIAIVGSPLKIKNPDEMFKLGKALRKHNVAVDVISFGESAELNTPFLDRFVKSVDKGGTSHLLSIPVDSCPPGGLSDALFSSPIVAEFSQAPDPSQSGATAADGAGAGAGAGAPRDFSEFGGVNPDVDPELAMALKASMEEEKERREREAEVERAALAKSAAAKGGGQEKKEGEAGGDEAKMGGDAPALRQAKGEDGGTDNAMGQGRGEDGDGDGDDDDEELRRALEASLMDDGAGEAAPGDADEGGAASTRGEPGNGDVMEDEDEDALLQKAMQMSMQEEGNGEDNIGKDE